MAHSQSDLVNTNNITIQTSSSPSQAGNAQSLTRPSDAAPRSFVGLTSAASIDTLAPGQPLDLQAVVYILERTARLWPGHVHVVDTHILDVLTAVGEDNEMFDDLRCQIASIPVGGVVLFPMCADDHHFLIVLKKCLNQGSLVCQALVYDSVLLNRVGDGGYIRRDYWNYIASRISLLHRSLFSFCPQMGSLYIDLVLCPQQPNDYDCGIAVCLNAMDIIAHKGLATYPTSEGGYCAAPAFDIIRGLNKYNREDDMPIINQLSAPGLYWSAGRKFVFQLCGRAIERPHPNREALLAARENVSAGLEALVRSEQATFMLATSPRSNPTGASFLLPTIDEHTMAWKLECWFQSRTTLMSLMDSLQLVASNLGTVTSRAEDVRVFTAALTVSIDPMHEAHRQRTREVAQDNAWQDPELVQELFADVTAAKLELEGLRLPEGWETAVPSCRQYFQSYVENLR